MALGVLNNLSAIYAENNLNKTNSSLQTVLQQLSSGSRINSGADDAAGLSLVNGLQANATALTQSAINATEGVGLLQVADGALSQITSLLNRAVTLATEASNGTLNSTQEAAANQEYQSLLAEITNIGSTTTYNQQQVFSGKTVSIYTGDSSANGASLDNLTIRTISSNSVGDTNGSMSYTNGQNNVFLNLSSSTANAASTDSLNASGSTTINVSYLTSSSGSAVTATATITVGTGTSYANTADGLISAINASGLGLSASFSTSKAAGTAATTAAGSSTATGILISGQGIGAGTSAGSIGSLSLAASTDALSGTLNVVGSDGTTHAVTLGTSGSTDTIANLANTLNAAGYGVTASVSGSTLNFTASSSTISVSGTGIKDAGTPVSLTNIPANATNVSTLAGTTIGTVSIGGTGGAVGDTMTGALYVTGEDGSTTTFNAGAGGLTSLAASINGANLGVNATVSGTSLVFTTTSADSIAAVSVKTPFTDTTAGTATVGLTTPAKTSSGSEYYSIGLSSTTGITDTSTNVTVGNTSLSSSTNRAFITDYDGSTGIATISYSDSAGVSLSGTKLTSAASAQSALLLLNEAISDVSSMDGYIGAQINTLNSISSVMTTQQQDVLSAQNAIQATDYATATSNLSKYEVLSQTGIAALAQANSIQQEVTKLLQ